jgi:hypothetical protein
VELGWESDLSQVHIKPMPTGIWLSGDVYCNSLLIRSSHNWYSTTVDGNSTSSTLGVIARFRHSGFQVQELSKSITPSPHLQNSPIGQSETVPQPNPKHAHPFLGRAPGQD